MARSLLVTYLLFGFVEVFNKVICCLPHVLLYFNRQHSWQDKSRRVKNRNTRRGSVEGGWTERWYREQNLLLKWAWKQVGQPLCSRMWALSVRTASAAKRSQHCPNTLGRRGQLRRRPCPPSSILLSTRWHQLTNEDSFQAAVTHAFPQPSATWEPGGDNRQCFYYIPLKDKWFVIQGPSVLISWCSAVCEFIFLNNFKENEWFGLF